MSRKTMFICLIFNASLSCLAQNIIYKEENIIYKPGCESEISKLIEKKPLPQKITNDKKKFGEWEFDINVNEAILSVKDSDGAMRTTRMIRYSADTILLLQKVEWRDRCDFALTPFNPARYKEFKFGLPIVSVGNARIKKDEMEVKRFLSLFK